MEIDIFYKKNEKIYQENNNSLETNFLKFYDRKIDLYEFIKGDQILNEMFYDSFDRIKNGEDIVITKKISKNEKIKVIVYKDKDKDSDLSLDKDKSYIEILNYKKRKNETKKKEKKKEEDFEKSYLFWFLLIIMKFIEILENIPCIGEKIVDVWDTTMDYFYPDNDIREISRSRSSNKEKNLLQIELIWKDSKYYGGFYGYKKICDKIHPNKYKFAFIFTKDKESIWKHIDTYRYKTFEKKV